MASIRQLLARLAYGILHPEEEVTRFQRFIANSYYFVGYCASRLRRHRAPQLASALSYRTIFSLIPLLALSLVMVRGIYGEEGIRRGLRAVMDFTGISELAIIKSEADDEGLILIDPDGPGGNGRRPAATTPTNGATDAPANGQPDAGNTATNNAAPDGQASAAPAGTTAVTTPSSPSAGSGAAPASDPAVVAALTALKPNAPLGGVVLANKSWLEKAALPGGQASDDDDDSEPGLPPSASAEAVADWIERFVDNTVSRVSDINLRWITLAAIGVFIYAAISLLIQIEDAFNAVCSARSGRPIISRITNYWTMLTLGSVVLVASFVIGEAYARILSQLPHWLEFLRTPVSIATKVGASWLLLLFAYSQMPNTRVRLKYAAIGAIVAAVLWEFGKAGLGWFIREMTGGQVAVYGSLALLPLFLLWVYVTWLIVLFGLELAHATQTVGPERREQRLRSAEIPVADPVVGIAVLQTIADRFDQGLTTTPSDVAETLGIAEHTTVRIIQRLTDAGVLLQAVTSADSEGITLARPAERLELRSVAEQVFPLTLHGDAQDRILALRRAQLAALGDSTLADLLTRPRSAPAAPPTAVTSAAAPAATGAGDAHADGLRAGRGRAHDPERSSTTRDDRGTSLPDSAHPSPRSATPQR